MSICLGKKKRDRISSDHSRRLVACHLSIFSHISLALYGISYTIEHIEGAPARSIKNSSNTAPAVAMVLPVPTITSCLLGVIVSLTLHAGLTSMFLYNLFGLSLSLPVNFGSCL
uniref:Uncharacterized protein n=1 Tax=Arundo donax TaxID=35708 RepID=A0A0A9H0A8_ARUDO